MNRKQYKKWLLVRIGYTTLMCGVLGIYFWGSIIGLPITNTYVFICGMLIATTWFSWIDDIRELDKYMKKEVK